MNLTGIDTYAALLEWLQRGHALKRVLPLERVGANTLQTVISADKNYIRWNCHGSSANRATAEGMQFVVEDIFRTNVDGLLRRYIMD